MDSATENKVHFKQIHRNKEIRVTLEFPEHLDPQAESEFITRLKEIYLKKIQERAMQSNDSALSYPTTKEKEATIND